MVVRDARNIHKSLGTPIKETRPAEVPIVGEWVKSASCGDHHTVAVMASGAVFTFGSGQLGHGNRENELVPRVVAGLAGRSVEGVAAARIFTAVWTAEGQCFTFGNGAYGRLGHGGSDNQG